MAINREIMRELKKRKSQPRIYEMIQNKRRNSGFLFTNEEAAYLLAGELGVDISKYLNKKELGELKNLQPIAPIKKVTKTQKTSISEGITVKVGGAFKMKERFLPKRMLDEAKKMSELVYPTFYIFENSIRNLILNIMERKYGKDWWGSKVPQNIKKKVEGRLKQEGKNRWHSRRNVHEIFYTDFGDLKLIITNNWDDFKDLFPRQDWITSRFSDLELSRNVIGHNNPLQNDDIKRINTYFRDWTKQLSAIKEAGVRKNE